MTLAVAGIGTAVPESAVSAEEALRIAEKICCRNDDQAQVLAAFFRHSGIENRHLAFPAEVLRDVLDGTNHTGSVFVPRPDSEDRGPTTHERMRHYIRGAGPLALKAARAALQECAVPAGDLTHLVTVSCTGFSAPGFDIELIERLGLSRSIERTHVGFMGCHGAFNGLRVARAFVDSGQSAAVLICALEFCVLHYHYQWDPKKMVANALFADGAAAVVGLQQERAPGSAWLAAGSGSGLFPDSAHAMTWNIGDHGFEMTLSARIPEMIARNLGAWLEPWLARHDLSIGKIGSWAIHPGGPRILLAVEEALGLRRSQTADSWEVLARYGNMSSPTVLFILERLRRRNAPRPCVALGFGPGLTVEAALFV